LRFRDFVIYLNGITVTNPESQNPRNPTIQVKISDFEI